MVELPSILGFTRIPLVKAQKDRALRAAARGPAHLREGASGRRARWVAHPARGVTPRQNLEKVDHGQASEVPSARTICPVRISAQIH
jgi:hypothetical protein